MRSRPEQLLRLSWSVLHVMRMSQKDIDRGHPLEATPTPDFGFYRGVAFALAFTAVAVTVGRWLYLLWTS